MPKSSIASASLALIFCSKKDTSARSLLSRAARLLEKGGQSLHPDQQAKQSQAVVSGYRDLQIGNQEYSHTSNQPNPTNSIHLRWWWNMLYEILG